MSYHLAGNRMTKLPLMFRVRMEGPAGDPEAFSQLPTFYQRWLIVKGKWLDSSASIGFKTEPGPLCLTPRCPPHATSAILLTVFCPCHLGQDAEGARLQVGGPAGPLVSLILRLALVFDHSLVHRRGTIHGQVFHREAPVGQKRCGWGPGWNSDPTTTPWFPHCVPPPTSVPTIFTL